MRINLNEIRIAKGLSLAQLAEMSGVSKSYLNYVESGRKIPTICIICKLSIALNVKPEELFDCGGCSLESLRKF